MGLFYWGVFLTHVSGSDLFAIFFALLYAVWGINYIWSISLQTHSSVMVGVVAALLMFLFSGSSPTGHELLQTTFGSIALLSSPIRWALSQFIYRHATGVSSPYAWNKSPQEHWYNKGFDLNNL